MFLWGLWSCSCNHKPIPLEKSSKTLNLTWTIGSWTLGRGKLQHARLQVRLLSLEISVLSGLSRFCTPFHLTELELAFLEPLERVAANHISVVNDILSWEKEVRAAEKGHEEGASICSSVKILSEQTGLSIESTKKVLWYMVREWECVFDGLARNVIDKGCREEVKGYMTGLKNQVSGNEAWCRRTGRYQSRDQ